MGYFWPCSAQSHFGVTLCACLKIVCISKMADHRARQTKIWDSRILLTHIWGTYDLLVCKGILGSFGAHVKMACNWKRLPIEQTHWNLGMEDTSVTYGVPLCIECWYSLHLPHSLANLWPSNVKIRISHVSYIAIATWLLGINLTCSNLASDQADRQGPWGSCS